MHVDTVEMIAIAAVVIAFVTYRQSRWQSVRLGKLMRMPVVFAVLGTVSLVSALGGSAAGLHVRALDGVIIGAELVVGLIAGWLMGRWTELEVTEHDTRSRLRLAGLGVWLGFIAVRIGLGVGAATFGATVAGQPATALLVIAVIKAVQAVMIRERLRQHDPRPLLEPAYAGDRS